MDFKKKFLKYLEYLFTKLVFFILVFIPMPVRKVLTIQLVSLLGKIVKKRVNLIKENLSCAFPEKTSEEIEKIAKNNLRNFGIFISEFVESYWFKYKKNIDKYIEIHPSKEEEYDMLKGGGIVILGHMGNWEWHGSSVGKWLPEAIYAIARRQSNPWNDKFIESIRNRGGTLSLYTNDGFFRYTRVIREKKVLCMLSDQDAGKDGIFVDFMNRKASTYIGPAILARTTKCPVYFGVSWHEGGKLHTSLEPLPLPDDSLREDPEKWEREFTQTWVQTLEKYIKKYPEDYFWVHNRWKSKPV